LLQEGFANCSHLIGDRLALLICQPAVLECCALNPLAWHEVRSLCRLFRPYVTEVDDEARYLPKEQFPVDRRALVTSQECVKLPRRERVELFRGQP